MDQSEKINRAYAKPITVDGKTIKPGTAVDLPKARAERAAMAAGVHEDATAKPAAAKGKSTPA